MYFTLMSVYITIFFLVQSVLDVTDCYLVLICHSFPEFPLCVCVCPLIPFPTCAPYLVPCLIDY